MHDRIVRKVPCVRMCRIDSAEGGKKLPGLQLKVKRQVRRLQEGLFNFDLGFVIVVEFENDVGKSFEIRIDCTVERELDIARIESALLRIMIAYFDMIEVARG